MAHGWGGFPTHHSRPENKPKIYPRLPGNVSLFDYQKLMDCEMPSINYWVRKDNVLNLLWENKDVLEAPSNSSDELLL